MTTHQTGTREEWLAARSELLAKEKELTRRGDELAAERWRAALGANREAIPLRDRRRDQP